MKAVKTRGVETNQPADDAGLKPEIMELLFEAAFRLTGGFGLIFLLLRVFSVQEDEVAASSFLFLSGVLLVFFALMFKAVSILMGIYRLLLRQCR